MALFIARPRVSNAERDTLTAILSVCPSVFLFVCHMPV